MSRSDLSVGEHVGSRSITAALSDLRQWQLFRIAAGYTVAAWLVIQVAATIAPIFDAPAWFLRSVILLAIAGFVLTVGYFFLFRQPNRERGWLGSRKYVRLLAAGALLAVIATAATWVVRGGLLFGSDRVSLAVLPFSDLSPGRDKAFFAEGVAEEILSTLAVEKDIKVLGRTSARHIERNPDPQAIRSSLGVTHLLEGSTRTSGDQLRVNVRLIDTSDGSQLWEEEYQGQLADVFAVQDRIASTVVQRLRGTFFKAAVREAKQTGIDTYQTYLAARALMRTRTEKTLNDALELARQVVEADPNYAPGRAMLAELYMHLSDDAWAYGTIPIMEARRLGLPHARESIRLAPDKADGYAALGLWLRDERGVAALRRAIELDPARAELRIWLGITLNHLGRHDEALDEYRHAMEIEPLWPVAVNRVVQVLGRSGKVAEARAAIDQFRRRGGSEAQALRFLAHIERAEGDISESIRLSREALKRDPTLPYARGWIVQHALLIGAPGVALAEPAGVQGDYQRLLINGDAAAGALLAGKDGARLWGRRDSDYGLWLLSRQRDWPAVVALYDRRPDKTSNFCRLYSYHLAAMALALKHAGRPGQASDLLSCGQQFLTTEMRNEWKSPDQYTGEFEVRQAAILAVKGDPSAIIWLERAVNAGWLGQYFSPSLTDWPEFDGLRKSGRLALLQRRIDSKIAKERAETLRVLGTRTTT